MNNNKKQIFIIVGTRPNFIKITQFKKVVSQLKNDIIIKIIHTGQHFDERMADVFFSQLQLFPDYFLNIKPNNPNQQIAEIIQQLDLLIEKEGKPDILMVVGDVNSTLAAALFANKAGIKLVHLESGLRSGDRTMPEEINRILTDEVTDYFFITEQSGRDNLIKEGKNKDCLFFVGNTMIDTLVAYESLIQHSDILANLSLQPDKYVLMTMHRPATVDNQKGLEKLFDIMESITKQYKLVFPIHPRTLKSIDKFGLKNRLEKNKDIISVPPLDYFSFQKLIFNCKFVITDSGGIQEESTFVRKPCLTLRPNTERPVTVTNGTNTLIPFELECVNKYVKQIAQNSYKQGAIPYLWDGKATFRIVEILSEILS